MLAAILFFLMFVVEGLMLIAGVFGYGPCAIRETGKFDRLAYFNPDTDLGYQPVPGAVVHSRKVCGTAPLYDVNYTINNLGWRKTNGTPEGESIFIFGGSFAFGEGLNDEESLPSVISRELGYRSNVVNFGFHGWGPHQMLRILETKREVDCVSKTVKHVVYVAITDHVRRCTGGTAWDPDGPRYVLDAGGRVKFDGQFNSASATLLTLVLRRSWVGQFALSRITNLPVSTDHDYETYRGIVAQASRIVKERYNAPFTVIIWCGRGSHRQRLIQILEDNEIDIVDANTLISGHEPEELVIAPGRDTHPNRQSHELIVPRLISHLGLDESAVPGQ